MRARRKESGRSVDNNAISDERRNATANQNKNGPRRIYSAECLSCTRKSSVVRFSSRLLDNSPFFPRRFLVGSPTEIPRLAVVRGDRLQRTVQDDCTDGRGTAGKRRGTSSISEAYVQSTFCACMHGGTEQEQPTGKLLSLRGESRQWGSIPPTGRNLESS